MTKTPYERPTIDSLASERILELLGPAQGYHGENAVAAPFPGVPGADRSASLHRR